MAVEPDMAGYREAMARKRQKLGQDVTFLVRGTTTWPSGTRMDPETGRPVDPYVEPTSTDDAEVVVRVTVVTRPLIGDPNDQSVSTPMGPFASDLIAFLVGADDFEPIREAYEARCFDVAYKITDKRPDGIGELDHWIVFGEET